MEHKQFKADDMTLDDTGHVNFRFAKMNVIDHDGDIIFPGAFEEGKTILLSAWNHGSWKDGSASLPIGKGVIHELNGYATFDGDFNLKTQIGRDHYETVKFNANIQEYSFGFNVLEKAFTTDTETNREIRILKKLDTSEASPVLLGAGIDTGTNSIKSADKSILVDGAKSKQYKEHAELVLEACADFVKRSQSIADLRTEEGKEAASEKNREGLKAIAAELSKAASELKRIAETDSEAEEVQAKQKAAELVAQFEYLNRSA